MTTDRGVLLVEDNPDDVALTLRAFSKNDIRNRVEVATSGLQALERLLGPTAPPRLPALILLDLNLPMLSGLEVLARLRAHERTRLVPIVILTSSTEPKDLTEAYRRGANSYLRKPVVLSDFIEIVRQLGLYWLVLNETADHPR